MAISTKQAVLDTIERTEFIYWSVFENSTCIATYNGDRKNVDESVNQLAQVLDGFDGYLDVVLSKRSKGEKAGGGDFSSADNKDIKLRVKCEQGKSTAAASAGNTNTIRELQTLYDRNLELEKKLLQRESDEKYNKLLARLDALENDEGEPDEDDGINGIERLINNPLIQRLADKFLPPSIPTRTLSGYPEDSVTIQRTDSAPETEAYKKEQIKKGGRAVARLLAIDGAAGDNLTLLADLAQLDPDTYKFLLGMLPDQVKKAREKSNG